MGMKVKSNKVNLQNVVWKEGKYYVAWNLNTAVSSFGDTRKEALESLREAVELHLEDIPYKSVNKIERPFLIPSVLQYA